MNRSVTTFVLAALCTGCLAMPRHPEDAMLPSLQTVVVIPVTEVTLAPEPD